jgi:hypothetical protein
MTTYIPADIVPAVHAWLDGQGLGAQVRTDVPETWTIDTGPLLIVADDGGQTQMPIKSRLTVRLTSWAAGRTEARRIVSTAAGLLLDGRPTGVAHVHREMGGVLDARDKATGADLASILLTVTARTVVV